MVSRLTSKARESKPILPRRDDGKVVDLPQVEQRLVAGNEDIGFRGNGTGKDRNIVGVLDRNGRIFLRLNDLTFRFQQGKESVDYRHGQAELMGENSFEFSQHRSAGQQLVVMNDAFQQFAAKTARGDTTRENVRVEENPHETSRKTSSSVK